MRAKVSYTREYFIGFLQGLYHTETFVATSDDAVAFLEQLFHITLLIYLIKEIWLQLRFYLGNQVEHDDLRNEIGYASLDDIVVGQNE